MGDVESAIKHVNVAPVSNCHTSRSHGERVADRHVSLHSTKTASKKSSSDPLRGKKGARLEGSSIGSYEGFDVHLSPCFCAAKISFIVITDPPKWSRLDEERG